MSDIVFKIPSMWDDGGAFHILTLKRGQERRMNHHNIIIEVLRAVGSQRPTRDQLQTLVKIRRKRFIQMLKHLVDIGTVIRSGNGTKFDPFRFLLSDTHRQGPTLR